jgi:hypothetical protein
VFEAASHNRLVLAFGGLLVAACILQAGWAGLDWTWRGFWNDVRTSRAYAAAGGEDLYPSASEGVLSGHLYGPAGFFLYAPVRLAATPGAAIRAGIAISALLVLIPFAAAFLRRREGAPQTALLLAAFFHLYWSSSTQSLWNVHVDAPAVGLVLLSWIALLRVREERGGALALAAAGAAAATAVWAKQTMAPALLLPPILLWMDGRRRQSAIVSGWIAACAVGLGVLFGWLYGFGDLWFTMFEVPSKHARHIGRLLTDFRQFQSVLDLTPLLAIAIFLAPIPAIDGRRARSALLYAAALLPFAALGSIKINGSENNYLGPDVFATLAICFAAAGALTGASSGGAARRAAAALLGFVLALQIGRTAMFLARDSYERSLRTEPGPSDEAFQYLEAHPGQAYFPWNPLAMLMAEGRLYHAAHGAVTLRQAGLPVSPEHWRAHAPSRARCLVYPGDDVANVLELMPELSKEVNLPGLSRWTVRSR